MNRCWLARIAVALAVLLGPQALWAQGYRGEVSVRGSALELREMQRDSLPEDQVPGEGARRVLQDGTVVTCIPNEFCHWFRSGDEEDISIMTQELKLVAWPGVRGLSAHVHLLSRYGSDSFWPRTDSEFEALAAYLSFDRGPFLFRGGRLPRKSGLGYYNFDGGSVLWHGMDGLRVEAFGGWGLARGVNEPHDGDLLKDADNLAPDERTYLWGFDVTGRVGRNLMGTFTYQREIRTDELALYYERIAADVRALWRRLTVDFSTEYDLAYDEFNEVLLRVGAPVGGGVRLTAHARHYTPFFELWTIWGAFTPVGYDEGGFSVAWTVPATALRLEGGGSWRSYEEADAGADFVGLEEDGWRGYGKARWTGNHWYGDLGYRAEKGSGAARYGGDVALGYNFRRGTYVAVRGTSSQVFSEFRLGEQITTGWGLDGAYELSDLVVTANLARYWLSFVDRPEFSDWTQTRGSVGISYRFGSGPASGRGEGGYR